MGRPNGLSHRDRIAGAIAAIALLSTLQGCATGGDEGDAAQGDVFQMPEITETSHQVSQPARPRSKPRVGEEGDDWIPLCALRAAPDAVLGVGLSVVVTAPAMPVIALLYVGGRALVCRLEHPAKPVVDTDAIAAKVTSGAEERMKKIFIEASKKIEQRDGEIKGAFEGLADRLREVGSGEREAIDKTGAKAISDIYREIEFLRGAEFELRDEHREEYDPTKTRPRLRLDD